mgnify:CR=1 FL=1
MAALVVVALATRPNRVLGNLENCQNLRKKVQIDLQTDTKLQIVGILVGKNCTKTPGNLLLKFTLDSDIRFWAANIHISVSNPISEFR